MGSLPSVVTRISNATSALMFAGMVLGASIVVCFAQDDSSLSIRVEAREVVVPVSVVQRKERTVELPNGGTKRTEWDHPVPGLTSQNFRIFEDGAEQRIKSITVEELPFRTVDDNLFYHEESFCTPRGVWASQDITPDLVNVLWNTDPRIHVAPLFHEHGPSDGLPDFPETPPRYRYLLSYVPPSSVEGSCHRVKVKLNHVDAKVFARDEYCNTKHSASDPLQGTELGSRLENYADSTETGNLPLSAQVGWFFDDLEAARVYVLLDLPWKAFDSHWNGIEWNADIAVLGLVYGKDGTLRARLSDTACEASGKLSGSTLRNLGESSVVREAEKYVIPSRYRTQMDLAPGTYTLKFAVTDGEKFGRVAIPVEVGPYDRNRLAISSVVLCKRFRKADEQTGNDAKPASKYVPLASKGIEFTPAGSTRFTKGDAMAAYFEIYEPLLAAAKATTEVQFRLRITRVDTGEIQVDSGLRDAMPYAKAGNPVIAVAQDVAIAKVPAGAYRLEVQASDSAGQATGWRATNFTIE